MSCTSVSQLALSASIVARLAGSYGVVACCQGRLPPAARGAPTCHYLLPCRALSCAADTDHLPPRTGFAFLGGRGPLPAPRSLDPHECSVPKPFVECMYAWVSSQECMCWSSLCLRSDGVLNLCKLSCLVQIVLVCPSFRQRCSTATWGHYW